VSSEEEDKYDRSIVIHTHTKSTYSLFQRRYITNTRRVRVSTTYHRDVIDHTSSTTLELIPLRKDTSSVGYRAHKDTLLMQRIVKNQTGDRLKFKKKKTLHQDKVRQHITDCRQSKPASTSDNSNVHQQVYWKTNQTSARCNTRQSSITNTTNQQ
jgi:hypothetical protein